MLLLRKFGKLQARQSFYVSEFPFQIASNPTLHHLTPGLYVHCAFQYSSVKLDSAVNDALENEIYKPKNHPGKVKLGCVEVPNRITAAIKKAAKGNSETTHISKMRSIIVIQFAMEFPDFPIKQLITDGAALSRYIHSRHLPMEQDDVYRKRRKLQNEVLDHMGYSKISEIGEP